MNAMRQAVRRTDLADERAAEWEALVEAQLVVERAVRRYRELFEMAPLAYLTTDRWAVVREANQAAVRLLGARGTPLPGRPLISMVALPERRAFRHALSRAVDTGRVEDWPLRLLPPRCAPVETRVCVRVSSTGRSDELFWILRRDGAAEEELLV